MENTKNVPVASVADVERMAKAITASGLYGIKKPEQAVALMLVAQAEGLHPAIAARDYHIIEGRPALKADAMLARFQEAGGCIKWIELSDTCAKAEFSHPKGGALVLDWTIERARQAGLACRDTWRKYPRSMLKARLISDGIRAVFPGVICGAYTPEEEEEEDISADKKEFRRVDAEIVKESPAELPRERAREVPPDEVRADRSRRSNNQVERLKAAAEKAAVVDVTPSENPAEVMRDALKQNHEEQFVVDWINGARAMVAQMGKTAAELKPDAIKAFGSSLPAAVHNFLMEVWLTEQNAKKEAESAPEPVEPEVSEPIPDPDPDGPGPSDGHYYDIDSNAGDR